MAVYKLTNRQLTNEYVIQREQTVHKIHKELKDFFLYISSQICFRRKNQVMSEEVCGWKD
jgi:type IV secretory pathway component VirB8